MDPLQEKKEMGRLSALLSLVGIEDQKSKTLLFIVSVAVLFSACVSFCLMPPFGSPHGATVVIERGARLSEVSAILYEKEIIRSRALFELCAKIVGGEKPVVAGAYLFKEPLSACGVASRIARGVLGAPSVRVTIPEGMSNKDMASIFMKALPAFNRDVFFEAFNSQEGYLFPDTYFFSLGATAEEIAGKMRSNFDMKIEPFKFEITASGHTVHEVVTMASILEKEAMTNEDKAIVSGVLWKRIAKGMPLQVDATFMYLLGKTSSQLTADDLKMKSPYNTYQNRGLPPGPIGNPGLDAIRAAIHPTSSPYLYYLSDKDGVMHYAKTFEEHKANKAKYLR